MRVAVAIGGGNVTDWLYDKTSVLKAAKHLHGSSPMLVKHMRQTMFAFTLETLLAARPAATTSDAGQARRLRRA